MADSFRYILCSVLIGGPSVPRVIVTTSPGMKEGKSTVSTNLAIALTELGRRVLLIDADLRRPRLHTILNVENEWGLSSILGSGHAIDDYLLDDLSRATKIENLRVLPSGPPASNVNALLYSRRLRALIERVKREFDTVLIDSPPLIHFADARVLSKAADGVILVLRAGATNQASALEAHELLTEDGTRIIGTVLNDWTPTKADARYDEQYFAYYTHTA
jgi:capsular exopolysaccharide synthesis family protein